VHKIKIKTESICFFQKKKMPSTHIERYIRSIFVQNIPAGITEDLFRQMLSQFGVLIHFHMFLDPNGPNNTNEQTLQTSRGYAFAEVSLLSDFIDMIYRYI
jgi:RNA recognition motif-containing protein